MSMRLATTATIILLFGTSASAHRLDEYLQATTISVEKDRVQAQIRLTPGVEVFRAVLTTIDTDADGVISESEQGAYMERMLSDLSLTLDGVPLQLRLLSSKFPTIAELKAGVGNILIDLDAEVPIGGPSRRLIFENHHQSRIAAYLVNCLIPSNPEIRIRAQSRNYKQSFYQLDYDIQVHSQVDDVQGNVSLVQPSSAWSSGVRGWLSVAALFLFALLPLLWWRAGSTRNVN
jgi:hypothetical protein